MESDRLAVAVHGFVLEADRFRAVEEQDINLLSQTQRFGDALADALAAGGADPILFSAAPASDFPRNRKLLFGRRSGMKHGVPLTEIPFVNIIALKHVSRFLSALCCGMPRMRKAGTRVVIVHGIHSAFLAAALVERRWLGVRAVAILTDPPPTPEPNGSGVIRIMRLLDNRAVRAMLPRFDGVVALTAALSEDFAPGVPSLVLEGFAPDSPRLRDKPAKTNSPPTVVYAGGISAEYGVDTLLEAYRMSSGEYDLHLYGKGSLVPSVENMAGTVPGLTYKGVFPASDLMEVYEEAALLVNPRPPDQDFVKYSFPSKLLEYMASGTAVLTTRLGGVPEEYWPHLISSGASASDLAEAIERALAAPTELASIGQSALRFAASKRVGPQGIRLVQFLRMIQSGPDNKFE